MDRGRPASRVWLLLLLLITAIAALAAASASATDGDGDESVGGGTASAAKKLRANGISTTGHNAAGEHGAHMEDLLASVLAEFEHLKSRFRSVEERNERTYEGGSYQDPPPAPERRTLQAAPRTVSLAQFNLFKRSVTTQLATLNESLLSTRAILEALQKAVNDKVGGIEQKAAELETRADDLETSLGGLAGDVAAGSDALAGAAALLDTTSQGLTSLTARLACVDAASDGNELVFSGCNVNIRNGAGQTESTNGKGNLIVGYNENDVGVVNRDGSHMIVVGPRHGWRGFGGIVSGTSHRQESGYASILGGMYAR